ncbi:hypothetical protein, partial [uncultured Polaribacter sp.]|uniref:Ig-like domain-containing protein n=1 Tax=uncultured Polaribacter sp. TaxID=174711 RepID=UPI00262C2B83
GTWSVDEASGVITFTPLAGFTEDPTPIAYNVEDNDGNVSNNATVTIDYVPVAVNDESFGNTVASDVTLNVLSNDTAGDAVVANTFEFGSTANPLPAGGTISGSIAAGDYQLTVAGEGVWSYDGSGSLTFDPEAGFTTDPTVIGYTVSDAEGNATSATVTVTYGELPPVANDNTDVTLNTTTQPSAPLQILTDDLLSDGVTSASPTNTTLDLDPNTAGVQDVLVVAGEGTWNYNSANGEIVFTPETISGGFGANFTADPTPIVYTLTENQTGLTDTATVTIDYQEVAPIANNDSSLSNPAGAVTLNPLTGAGADTDADGTIAVHTVSLIAPVGATSITPASGDANNVTSFAVPGEGTWSVDEASGVITFTPLAGFTEDPTPISYNVEDNDGNVSNNATVTIDYVPVAVNDESFGNTVASDVTLNVLSNDTAGDAVVANTFVFGSTANPLPAGGTISGSIAAGDYQLTVAGEGVWSYDGSGSLTFDPEAGFTTDPTVIGYTVSDAEGNATSATVTVTYGELPPVANDNTDVTLNTTTQPSAPLQILT